ncbi:hypothetical protein GCM10027589_19860 [Actinocorallia lasiicapitis]
MKSTAEFGTNFRRPDGLAYRCKPCTNALARDQRRERLSARGEQVREKVPLPPELAGQEAQFKRCPDCGEFKTVDCFGRNKATSDGCAAYCKTCFRRRSNAQYRKTASRLGKAVQERVEVPDGFKRCPACEQVKAHADWHRAASSSDGFASACKACRKERSARDWLKRSYGLTPEDVERMVAEQGGLCAICGVRAAEHVDHDHRTGKVRGMLCFACNVTLGQFNDEAALFLRAVAYLQAHGTLDELELPVFVKVGESFWELAV